MNIRCHDMFQLKPYASLVRLGSICELNASSAYSITPELHFISHENFLSISIPYAAFILCTLFLMSPAVCCIGFNLPSLAIAP